MVDTDCLAAAELVVHLRDAQVSINLALDQYVAMTTTPKEVC